MIRTPASLFFSLLTATCSLAISQAATVVSVTGNNGTVGFVAGTAFTTSWTSNGAYSGVSISALVSTWGGGSMTAYLTTKAGAGATVSDQIATVTLSLSALPTATILFSDLFLPAGTYYLTIQNVDSTEMMWGSGTTTNVAAGTTAGQTAYSGALASYAPASTGSPTTYQMIYTVTGTAVPEPSAVALALGGSAFFILRRRNR